MLNEADIVKSLQKKFPEIGDDAAVIDFDSEHAYVVTKDLLVEDVHFTRDTDFRTLANKALQVNLSDIAAMGAEPRFVLLGLSIPQVLEAESKLFLDAFSNACIESNLLLIGGDTTKSPGPFFISVTVIGIAKKSHLKYRSTAKVGDEIIAIGHLGWAHLGLLGVKEYEAALTSPKALLEVGKWAGESKSVTSMMDISDGLYIDLTKLCEASSVGAEINLENFKPEEKFIKACAERGLDPLNVQLIGGEDYGLLMTIDSQALQNLNMPYMHIGKISSEKSIRFFENGKEKQLHLKPFTHFGECNKDLQK